MLLKTLHRVYGILYRIGVWRKRHVTAAGIMVLVGLWVTLLVGFNVLRTHNYQLGVLFFILIGVSLVSNLLPFRPKLEVKRRLSGSAMAGQPYEYRLEITNKGRTAQKDLLLFEAMIDPCPTMETLKNFEEPFEKKRNLWDRKILFFRWQWLLQRRMKLDLAVQKLPVLKPGETVNLHVKTRPKSRGYFFFSGVTLARPDIFGLFNRTHFVELKDRQLILPEICGVRQILLQSNRRFHPGGENLASSIGNSDEFISLRPYRPGDPRRTIHWRSFAKTAQLVVKEYEDEHFVRHALILDTFCSAEKYPVFEKAVSLAASYVIEMQTAESILDLLFAGRQFYSFSTGRGLGQISSMLEVLACVEPLHQKSMAELIPVLKQHIEKVSGALCICIGWNESHRKLYRMFERFNIDVRFVVVCESEEPMKTKINDSMGSTDFIDLVAL